MKIFSISLMLLVLAGGIFPASAAEQAQVPLDKFRPQWQLGQQWTVETQSQQQQRSLPRQQAATARWHFQVEAVDQLQGKPCWRIVIRIVQGDQLLAEPKTTVWIEQASAAIRQIETQLPTPRGYQRATESYQSGAQAAPVVGLQSLLPIALPQFPEAGVKALDTFQYETVSGPGGVKAVGELGFVTDVRQELIEPTEEGLKAVFDEPEIKALEDAPLLEVKLTTPEQTVRQIWREAAPWPEYADNGVTQMRLVHVDGQGVGSRFRRDSRPNGETMPENDSRPRGLPPASEMPDHVDGTKSLIVSGGLEKATAKTIPWSGYWWPMREGRLLVPLGKYDKLTGHRAAEWERTNNPPGPDVPRWHGYCHAWAAASIMEPEPRNNHVAVSLREGVGSRFRGDGRPNGETLPENDSRPRGLPPASEMPDHVRLNLDIGDQKGLLTACHTENLANSWGDRFGDGLGSDDPLDIYPNLLWRLLKLHLGQQGVPLVLDVEPGEEVWNFPVYHYEVQYGPVDGGVGRPAPSGMYQADMTLLMADDGVPPAYLGTKIRKQTYQFTFQMRDGNIVMGSGRWTGQSVNDHPDFAWYPYMAVASNPEVIYAKVQQLVTGRQTAPPAKPPAKPKPKTKPPATPPTTPPYKPPVELVTTPAQAPVDQAAAEPVVISPLELVALIASQTSSFAFDVTVDRFDGATYKPGERFFVRVKSDRPGYLYLLQVDNSGTPALLYPTAGEDNRIPAGKSVEIRPAGVAEGFPVAGPAGTLRIKSVVTSKPLAFSGSLEWLQSAVPGQQQQQDQGQAAPFRWHPAQQQQVKQWLAAQQQPTVEQIGAKQPEELLGPFAQDMTMIYVDTS